MTNQDSFNNIKSNLSLVYIRAIAAKLNFAFQESSRDVDGIGIDCTIYNHGMGSENLHSLSSEIKVQVKAFSKSSTTMYRDNSKVLEYRLSKNLNPQGAVFYLIVVELPEEDKFDEWLQITTEELVLKRCAYYIRVQDEVKAGYIKIPKLNRLNHKTLPTLFISSTKKELEV